MSHSMNYCSDCSSSQIVLKTPLGDNRKRQVCENCDQIFYENPKIVCGTLPVFEDKVLLCKRAINPRKGYWTLPAGFMENGETLKAAAKRETWEEALAKLISCELYFILNLPRISQVYFFFLGEVQDGNFGVGEETLASDLFPIEQIPWDELAFKTVSVTLKQYIQDRDSNQFPMRMQDI